MGTVPGKPLTQPSATLSPRRGGKIGVNSPLAPMGWGKEIRFDSLAQWERVPEGRVRGEPDQPEV